MKVLQSYRFHRIILTIFLFQLASFSTAFAQKSIDLKFEHISIREGLSQSSVTVIYQDSRGFLWLGTQDGLNRYDGYSFTIFKNNSSDSLTISDNWITSISEDKNGNLWIGTAAGGINKFDRKTEKFKHFQASGKTADGLKSNRILATYIDLNEILWIGTADAGLCRFDLSRQSFSELTSSTALALTAPGKAINSIASDGNNNLWFGTDDGLFEWDPRSDEVQHFQYNSKSDNSICDNQVNTVEPDIFGNIWIGTDNGLSLFDPVQKSFRTYSTRDGLADLHIRSILITQKGDVWLGTDRGISVRRAGDKQFSIHRQNQKDRQSLSENLVISLFEDGSGIVWIGTHGGGLNKYDLKKNIFKHYRQDAAAANSLIDNNVWCFYEDRDGKIWIGTNNGINRFDPLSENFIQYKPEPGKNGKLSHAIIRSISEDKFGNIWCGTDGGGVCVLDRRSGRFKTYRHNPNNQSSLSDDKIRHIYLDSKSVLWIATWNGLDRYNHATGSFEHFRHDPAKPGTISDNRVRSLFEDSAGNLWVGTYGGLNRFNRESQDFTSFIHNDSDESTVSNDRVLCITEDRSGRLWVGTFLGLNKFNPADGVFKRYTVEDGLPNDVIYGIVEDDQQNLWFSTNKGLVKFNPSLSKLEPFKNYDVHDGLQSNEFNGGAYLRHSSGELYFGGINGFNRFTPGEVKENKYIAPVIITAFKKFDKLSSLQYSISETDQIHLSYKDNFFSFEFAALDFSNPEKNQYAYKLEGFDNHWIECGTRRYASYTNLDGGEYEFKVRGANNDGIWNEKGDSVRIIIDPPYWHTWWFRILAAVTLIAAGYFYTRSKVQQVKIQREKLEKLVAARTGELETSNKNLQEAQREAQRLAAQTGLLYEVGLRISKELDLDSLLDKVVISARDAFDYYNVMLFLCDKEKHGLVLKSIAGGYKNVFPPDLFLKFGQGMNGQAVITKETQVSNDVTKNPDYYKGSEEVTLSELCVPILDGEEVLGVLDMQSNQLDSFKESDVEVAETFTLQIAAAIKNARLYNQAQTEISERKKAEEQLLDAKRETDNILKNVEEGLFLIYPDLKIGAQYSKSLERIFSSSDLAQIKITRLLENKIAAKLLKSFTEYLELMFRDDLDEETLFDLNPLSEVEISLSDSIGVWKGSKFLTFKFKRIYNSANQIIHLIATVTDITDQKLLTQQLEKSEAEQKKQIEWMLSILHVEPVLLKEFIDSAKAEISFIAQLLRPKGKSNGEEFRLILQNAYRSMHLIKGNASLLDLQFFEKKAHAFESSITEIVKSESIQGSHFVTLVLQLEEMRKMMGEIDNLIERLGNIHNQFRPKREYESKLFIKSLTNLINNISRDYNKKVNFDYSAFDVQNIPFEYRLTIKEVLVQLIRNAIFHGIETPEERLARQKSEEGSLQLACERKDGLLILKLKDDGDGLKLEKLKSAALKTERYTENELNSWDAARLGELIFEPGISTSDRTDLVAGRGVGMDAVKERINRLKGEINVNYEKGRYCEFNIQIPVKKKANKN